MTMRFLKRIACFFGCHEIRIRHGVIKGDGYTYRNEDCIRCGFNRSSIKMNDVPSREVLMERNPDLFLSVRNLLRSKYFDKNRLNR